MGAPKEGRSPVITLTALVQVCMEHTWTLECQFSQSLNWRGREECAVTDLKFYSLHSSRYVYFQCNNIPMRMSTLEDEGLFNTCLYLFT